ncbi:MAG: hypothetical protein FWH03_01195 [Firmicutes bacterium]|nr:hypothetical protein [Bacillota bacterium]
MASKDFFGLLSEAVGSVTNRKKQDEDMQNGLEDLAAFINELNKPQSLPDRPDLGELPQYQRLAVEEKSAEDLERAAQSNLADYKLNSVNAIEREIELLNDKLSAEKETANQAAKDKNAALASAYDSAKKAVNDDTLKRGLARSSIAVNKQAQLADAKAAESTRINAAFIDAINKLDNEIEGLTHKRETALNNFNISYAAKLTQQINTLKEEQDKRKTEAIKYNNTLSEKEHSASVDKMDKEASIYGKELDNRAKENNLTAGQTNKDEAIYKKMVEVLDSMNGADARKQVMENPVFRDNVSDYYFYKLYDRYTR